MVVGDDWKIKLRTLSGSLHPIQYTRCLSQRYHCMSSRDKKIPLLGVTLCPVTSMVTGALMGKEERGPESQVNAEYSD